jgi:uncharacterized membrane protein YgcG
MNCPACSTDELQELTAACPRCGFELASLDRELGFAPKLRPGITDLAGFLSKRQHSKLSDQLHELALQFPQCRFAALLVNAPSHIPLAAYVFWLFNKAGIAAPIEKGAHCRVVLVVIDTATATCCCMVGYGLEPFLTRERLQRVTEATSPYLSGQDFAAAFHVSFDVLHDLLQNLSMQIPTLFGIEYTGPPNEQNGEVFAY